MIYKFWPGVPHEFIPLRGVELDNFAFGNINEFESAPCDIRYRRLGGRFMVRGRHKYWHIRTNQIGRHLDITASA